MFDSYVVVWQGPRRGGKTGSMSAEEAVCLINGRRVFTNCPVSFDFQEDEDSPPVHYETEPLIYDELLKIDTPEFKEKYTGSVIAWDEPALWFYAKNWQSPMSKMFGLIITLIGKLGISFFFTCQFLKLLDNGIRLQMDALAMCTDLSFRYPNMKRGGTIGQLWQDISGRYTGQMYEMTERMYQQTLNLELFWSIFNTALTYNIAETQAKMKIIFPKKVVNLSSEDDIEYLRELNSPNEAVMAGDNQNIEIIRHLIGDMATQGKLKIPSSILFLEAKANGFVGKPMDMSFILNRLGASVNGARTWDLSEAAESLLISA